MEAPASSNPGTESSRRGGHHRRAGGSQTSRGRGSRGGHASRNAAGRSAAGSESPAAPTGAAPERREANEASSGRGRRGRGRGAAGPRVQRNQRPLVAGQRAFGGHLTSEPAASEGSSSQISGDAPEFVPGQAVVIRETASQAGQGAPKGKPALPKAPKSTAEDLPTRIHEDISNGHYECVICTNEVLRNSRVWSCSICWTVAHLTCVKKWYSNRAKNGENEPQITWRCPGCNSQMTEEPNTYHCWCGKEIGPRAVASLPPHSCGQTCSKPRPTCPHPCSLQCHAGPCPPCTLMGPNQSCYCGKHTSSKRCSETDYAQGWSCQEICDDLLPCGEHTCPQPCHAGLCGSCEVQVSSHCYCGREFQEIACEQRGDKMESFNYGQVQAPLDPTETDGLPESWFWGSFQCASKCGRAFDCGEHTCQKECHALDPDIAQCPFSPDSVTRCPCGKTDLGDILDAPRTNCRDPIPSCDKMCGKLLPCGHICDQVCHTGPCRICVQKMEVTCRCGRTTSTTICHQGTHSTPECMRVCRAQLNCGRHECGEHCCPGEKKAMERSAAKRKNKNLGVSGDVESEHICVRVCGRPLKCGKHSCQQLCHRGPCASCPEAIFEEIGCHCGRTVLQPPQPCGTVPPECRFDCTRPRACGHPQTQHNCHTDDKTCAKCPFLVEKACICGKKRLKNQPCWFEEPRCGLPCGKKLKCGAHTCTKPCHRPGECEDVEIRGSHCTQPCMKNKKACDHVCIEQCHAPFPCKEDKPCQAKTFVTCDCQTRKQEVKCMATRANPQPSRPELKCDDECLRLQRNRRLADALNIDPETHTDDHIPYSETTLKLFKEDVKWAQTQEREFRVFANEPESKAMRFKPMPSQQRAFLHALAEDFGLDSESQDPEPHRHVCIFKTPRFVSAPAKTLQQCVKLRAVPTAESTSSKPSTMRGGLAMGAEEPYNAILLSDVRFGLTIEEIDTALERDYDNHLTVRFTTGFLPSDEVVLQGSGPATPQALETSLLALLPALSLTIKQKGLAKTVGLCHVDTSLNVLRREPSPAAKAAGGWNQVAGRSASRPQQQPEPTLDPAKLVLRSRYAPLKAASKKKLEQEPVEDDWEAAAEHMDDDEGAEDKNN